MLREGIVSFICRLMHVQTYASLMKNKRANSHEGITWSKMGKQNMQAKESNRGYIFRGHYRCCQHFTEESKKQIKKTLTCEA